MFVPTSLPLLLLLHLQAFSGPAPCLLSPHFHPHHSGHLLSCSNEYTNQSQLPRNHTRRISPASQSDMPEPISPTIAQANMPRKDRSHAMPSVHPHSPPWASSIPNPSTPTRATPNKPYHTQQGELTLPSPCPCYILPTTSKMQNPITTIPIPASDILTPTDLPTYTQPRYAPAHNLSPHSSTLRLTQAESRLPKADTRRTDRWSSGWLVAARPALPVPSPYQSLSGPTGSDGRDASDWMPTPSGDAFFGEEVFSPWP